jgi:hypothetical protein
MHYANDKATIYNKDICIEEEICAGQVWRHSTIEAFGDHLVLGMSDKDRNGDVWVRLARPYAYASCVGTTGPTVLTGSETYDVSLKTLITRFTCVGGRGERHKYVASGLAYVENRTQDTKIAEAKKLAEEIAKSDIGGDLPRGYKISELTEAVRDL